MKTGSYDSKFNAMAVDMVYVKSTVNETRSRPEISNSLSGKWRRMLKQGGPFVRAGTTLTEEEKQIKRLQWEFRESNLERDFLKKAVSIFSREDGKHSGLYRDILIYFRPEKMCSVLKVSVSGYYYWLTAPVGPRAQSHMQLVAEIKSIYQQRKGRYGSPRITG